MKYSKQTNRNGGGEKNAYIDHSNGHYRHYFFPIVAGLLANCSSSINIKVEIGLFRLGTPPPFVQTMCFIMSFLVLEYRN